MDRDDDDWKKIREALCRDAQVVRRDEAWLGFSVGDPPIPLVVACREDVVEIVAGVGRCRVAPSVVLRGVRRLAVGGVVEENGILLLREVRLLGEARAETLLVVMARLAAAVVVARRLAGLDEPIEDFFHGYAD